MLIFLVCPSWVDAARWVADAAVILVKEGDRIAQLILERIYTPEVAVVEELEESVRGAGGFGSTGV